MNFRVGQKVVRVGSSKSGTSNRWRSFKYSFPKMNEVCTIATINHWPSGTLLTFVEHNNSHFVGQLGYRFEPGFPAECFRPVVERKTDISVFMRMLDPDAIERAKREHVNA